MQLLSLLTQLGNLSLATLTYHMMKRRKEVKHAGDARYLACYANLYVCCSHMRRIKRSRACRGRAQDKGRTKNKICSVQPIRNLFKHASRGHYDSFQKMRAQLCVWLGVVIGGCEIKIITPHKNHNPLQTNQQQLRGEDALK